MRQGQPSRSGDRRALTKADMRRMLCKRYRLPELDLCSLTESPDSARLTTR